MFSAELRGNCGQNDTAAPAGKIIDYEKTVSFSRRMRRRILRERRRILRGRRRALRRRGLQNVVQEVLGPLLARR